MRFHIPNYTAQSWHQQLGEKVEALLPTVTNRILQGLRHPELRRLLPPYRAHEILEDDVLGFLDQIKLVWNTRRKPHSRVNATAIWRESVLGQRDLSISFNPYAIRAWAALPAPSFEARLLDLILHEAGHLLDRKYTGGWGHGPTWRLWGRAIGYVPVGSTTAGKKLARAVSIHDQRREETMTGVHRHAKDGWIWTCGACGTTSQAPVSRDKARESYRIHRREICSGGPMVVATDGGTKATSKSKAASTPKTAPKAATPTKSSPKAPKKPQSAPRAVAGATLPLWRVASITNTKTGNTRLINVKRDGSHLPRFAHLPKAKEYREIRAGSWAEASAAYRAGKGEVVKVR